MTREWMVRAACLGAADWEDAFGTGEQQQAFVRSYCGGCSVKPECYRYGRDEHGVFGGITQKARSRMLGRKLSALPRAAA